MVLKKISNLTFSVSALFLNCLERTCYRKPISFESRIHIGVTWSLPNQPNSWKMKKIK